MAKGSGTTRNSVGRTYNSSNYDRSTYVANIESMRNNLATFGRSNNFDVFDNGSSIRVNKVRENENIDGFSITVSNDYDFNGGIKTVYTASFTGWKTPMYDARDTREYLNIVREQKSFARLKDAYNYFRKQQAKANKLIIR